MTERADWCRRRFPPAHRATCNKGTSTGSGGPVNPCRRVKGTAAFTYGVGLYL